MSKLLFEAKYTLYFPNSEHLEGTQKTRAEWEKIVPVQAKKKFDEWFELIKTK